LRRLLGDEIPARARLAAAEFRAERYLLDSAPLRVDH